MDKEKLENILKETFDGHEEVLLIGKESKIYIDTKGEPVFLENISTPGLVIVHYEEYKPFKAEVLGKPHKYKYYCLGRSIDVSESRGFALAHKEIIAVDFFVEQKI